MSCLPSLENWKATITEVSGTTDSEYQTTKEDFATPEGETIASNVCWAVIDGNGGNDPSAEIEWVWNSEVVWRKEIFKNRCKVLCEPHYFQCGIKSIGCFAWELFVDLFQKFCDDVLTISLYLILPLALFLRHWNSKTNRLNGAILKTGKDLLKEAADYLFWRLEKKSTFMINLSLSNTNKSHELH